MRDIWNPSKSSFSDSLVIHGRLMAVFISRLLYLMFFTHASFIFYLLIQYGQVCSFVVSNVSNVFLPIFMPYFCYMVRCAFLGFCFVHSCSVIANGIGSKGTPTIGIATPTRGMKLYIQNIV